MVCVRCGTVFCDDTGYFPEYEGVKRLYCSKSCAKKAKPSWRTCKYRRRERLLCAERGKPSYPSEDWALASIACHDKDVAPLLRPYRCACGSWHITKRPLETEQVA